MQGSSEEKSFVLYLKRIADRQRTAVPLRPARSSEVWLLSSILRASFRVRCSLSPPRNRSLIRFTLMWSSGDGRPLPASQQPTPRRVLRIDRRSSETQAVTKPHTQLALLSALHLRVWAAHQKETYGFQIEDIGRRFLPATGEVPLPKGGVGQPCRPAQEEACSQ